MRSISITKDYSDEMIDNVFVLTSKSKGSIKLDIESYISSAKETVCMALEFGMQDDLAKSLSSANARVYALVPKIDEAKYLKLKGKAIVREVPNIKGSYCIIDNNVLLLFDEGYEGVIVKSRESIEVVKKLFQREFWENSTEEFINKKVPCAEITFDIPPIYGNDNVIIDEGFGVDTSLKSVLDKAEIIAYNGKVPPNAGNNIIISKIFENSSFLKNSSSNNILYSTKLPFCYFVENGDTYALSFNAADYNNLPEKGRGRLFAVKIDKASFGDSYKFYRHKSIGDLVGETVIDADGRNIKIEEFVEEKRKIEVDLKSARELEGLESDNEMLEARLLKKDKSLLNSAHISQEIYFNIELKIQKRSFTQLANVYSDFDKANKEYKEKLKELDALISKLDDNELKKDLSKINRRDFTEISDYEKGVKTVNELINKIYSDDSLAELLGNKKAKKTVSNLNPVKISMNIPKYGELYQDNGSYEYALKGESYLDAAINEIKSTPIGQAPILYLEDK